MSGCWAAALCFSRERRRAGPAAMRQACSLVRPGSPESLCGPCSVSPGCLPLDASGSGRRCWQLWAADWHYSGGTINGEFLIPPVTRSFLLNHVCPLRSLQNLTSSAEVLPVFVRSGFSFFFFFFLHILLRPPTVHSPQLGPCGSLGDLCP